MVRKTVDRGPRLEALLDERDHLRVKISLAGDQTGEEIFAIRRRLVELDRQITRHWGGETSASGAANIDN
jgi:hypothetical protein